MGGGNGAKSAQSRERNAKAAAKGPSSQLKSNAAALTTQCAICRAVFQSTAKAPALQSHIDSKHSAKRFEECFPGIAPPVAKA